MSSRQQPALPGASHGLRRSCTAGPPHLALPWTPAATLQAFGQGDAYVHNTFSGGRQSKTQSVLPRQKEQQTGPAVCKGSDGTGVRGWGIEGCDENGGGGE